MKLIWKEPFSLGDVAKSLPRDAEIIHVGVQDGTPTFWYRFDEEDKHNYVTRQFRTIGTGWDHPDRLVYRGTFFLGEYVWHLMEDV